MFNSCCVDLENNFVVKGWRDVPVDNTVLGRLSAEFVPCIKQLLFQSSPDSVNDNQKDFEKRLYDTRRQIQVEFAI